MLIFLNVIFLELQNPFPSATQGDEIPVQIEVCREKTKHILLNRKVDMK